jgi:hypothetical protein
MLLHMNAALAGVVLPTIALIALAAIPYIDRSREGQGTWFGTLNAVRITVFSTIYTLITSTLLILLDSGKHAQIYEKVTGTAWPFGTNRPDWLPDIGIITALWDLVFIRSIRAIQTEWTWSINIFGLDPGFSSEGKNGVLDWPEDFSRIPLPIINGTWWPRWGASHGEQPPQWYEDLPDWLTGLYPYDLYVNFPAMLVEIVLPTIIMVGLSVLLCYILWRLRWLRTRRDLMIAIFTGFMVVFWVMTIVGSAFRGAGQELVWPWDVPRIDG